MRPSLLPLLHSLVSARPAREVGEGGRGEGGLELCAGSKYVYGVHLVSADRVEREGHGDIREEGRRRSPKITYISLHLARSNACIRL